MHASGRGIHEGDPALRVRDDDAFCQLAKDCRPLCRRCRQLGIGFAQVRNVESHAYEADHFAARADTGPGEGLQPSVPTVMTQVPGFQREGLARRFPRDRFGYQPGLVVGVDEAAPVRVAHRLVVAAHIGDIGLVDEDALAVLARDPDQNRGRVGDGSKTLFALSGGIQGFTAFGHVERQADVTPKHAFAVETWIDRHLHPAPGAVGASEPAREAIGFLVGTGLGLNGRDACGILRMNRLFPDMTQDRFGRVAIEFDQGRVDELDLAFCIRQPDRRRSGIGQPPETLVALAQLGFGDLLCGDIDGDGHEPVGTIIFVAQGPDAQQGPNQGAVRPDIPFRQLTLVAHLLGRCDELVGWLDVVGVGEIGRPLSRDGLQRSAQHLAEPCVGTEDPAVQVGPDDPGRGLVQHGAQLDVAEIEPGFGTTARPGRGGATGQNILDGLQKSHRRSDPRTGIASTTATVCPVARSGPVRIEGRRRCDVTRSWRGGPPRLPPIHEYRPFPPWSKQHDRHDRYRLHQGRTH